MQDLFIIIGLFIVSFLLGSIPFGLIISKVFFAKDLRDEGSGNIGTTNAIRSMGKVGGFSVFALDFGKGVSSGFLGLYAATLISPEFTLANPMFNSDSVAMFAFAGCILGHIYSPWLKFKGGKGIAVAIGAIFPIFGFGVAFAELGIFIILVLTLRYVSVGSIASAAANPFFAVYLFPGNLVAILLSSIGACAIVFAHRGNIQKLLSGVESRVGNKKKGK